MSYADLTTQDPNSIKSWIQQRRLRDAASVLHVDAGRSLSVFDFGAGNGEFSCQIANFNPGIRVTAYEPTPALVAEALELTKAVGRVEVVNSLDGVVSGGYDYVFCLEVFEHLPPAETDAVLAQIKGLLKPGGWVVVGVPYEVFLPALVKGAFRMTRRYGSFDASPGNVLRAALGRPPTERPVGEIAPGLSYHFDHLGFDHRAFEKVAMKSFNLRRRWFSPLPFLGPLLNSEVYYLLQ